MSIKAKRKPVNYVDGRTLHNALVDWYKTDDQQIPTVIVDAIWQICDRLATKGNFRNYTFIQDMKSSALLSCTNALVERKYNPQKGENPFAYFTQIAYNEFIRVITDEKRQSYIKHKSLEHHVIDSLLAGDMIETPEDDDSGRLEALVNKFEKKKDVKKDDKE